MKRSIYLLVAVIGLYVVLSLTLHLIYGPSYPFPPSSDSWRPDGSGGWTQIGQPNGDPPAVASVEVPVLVSYIPLLVPGLLLVVFLFTPLSRKLEGPQQEYADLNDETASDSGPDDTADSDNFADEDESVEPEDPETSK